jgi:hypothetical protein
LASQRAADTLVAFASFLRHVQPRIFQDAAGNCAFEFNYPHSWLWIDVPDGKNGVQPWGFEGASPSELNNDAGWTRATVKKGDKVTVTFCPLRDGRNGGAFVSVLLPDGRTIMGTRNSCVAKYQQK